MGCVQGKPGSPNQDLERRKKENGYVKGRRGGGGGGGGGKGDSSSGSLKKFREFRPIESKVKIRSVVFDQREIGNGESGSSGKGLKSVEKKKKKIGGGGGVQPAGVWPKWLLDNIPQDVLAGFVPRSADSYDKLAKIGHGTYSNVYKARDRETKMIVALKKVRFDTSEPESIKFMAREIVMLQKLDHPNVIKLKGLATSRLQYSLYLVFDFMQADLAKVISRSGQKFNEAQVKCYMQQLLSGLQHCHEKGILHRDIKASNLLVDKSGRLKIADFGLANYYPPKQKKPQTSRVVTLWYRAPELLLGSTDYGVGIDLWSAGCLFAEMFIGRPFMPGRTEVEQLHKIFKLCGSPPDEFWTKMKLLTSFRPPQHYKPSFEEVFKDFPHSSLGLLNQLLALDPAYRGTAASALQSDFFSTSPLACDLSDLPAIQIEDEPTRGKEKNKKKSSKSTKLSETDREFHDQQKKLLHGEATSDLDYFNEEKKNFPTMHNQETGNSASSSTSTTTTTTTTTPSSSKQHTGHEDHQNIFTDAYLSPILSFHRKRFSRTEAHPNALKNINPDVLKNINFSTLLQASVPDILNHKEDSALAQYFRSLSALDFRNRDPEKMSESFVSDKE